jgi:prepilin peptidase CpaA
MGQVDVMQLIQLPPVGTLSPFLLSVVMAAGDWRSRRIPNYLTFGGALAGVVFQTAVFGWPGLAQALLGLLLGLGLLLLPYVLGGMGAGDVKALAALGAWLGPKGVFSVFCYMALAGGIMSLGVLLWKGDLWRFFRKGWASLTNLILSRGQKIMLESLTPGEDLTEGLPYGVAIALGMAAYVLWGNLF